MRIVWVSHSSEIGGAELCLLEAIAALSDRGVSSLVIVPSHGELVHQLRGTGTPVFVLDYRFWVAKSGTAAQRIKRMLRNVRAVYVVKKLVSRLNPDLVVTNTLATPVGAIAARWLAIPHIWYIHEFGEEDHGLFFDLGKKVSFEVMNRLSNALIVNSHAVREKFARQIPKAKLKLVYYGVEIPSVSSDSNMSALPFRLVSVGVKSSGKRQEDALRAVAILRDKGIDSHLTLVGREVPVYGEYLRQLAGHLGIHERLQMVPFTPEPLTFAAQAHVALVCSSMEAFGRVTVEAMKLGKPVVGAASGGTTELILDGWNGLLYRPGDASDLASKLESLYYDRAALEKMGRNAKLWAHQTFSRPKYGAALHDLFTATVKPT